MEPDIQREAGSIIDSELHVRNGQSVGPGHLGMAQHIVGSVLHVVVRDGA